MIYEDTLGYPVDQTLDGGDSAVRTGILAMCDEFMHRCITNYSTNKGTFIRHPHQDPWDNHKNFSRDQMMMLLAGFHRQEYNLYPHQHFFKTMKRFFFAQNFERDYPGTTKYPWPHKVDGKWRLFDFADPLAPNHIGAIILAGRVRWAYPFLPLCMCVHLISLFFHSRGKHHEENQMIAECYIYGTLKLYRKWNKNWIHTSREYWARRNEIEYHDMLVKLVESTT